MTRRITIALVLAVGLTAGAALAARDSAGTYSRPSGNPVTSGTPIAATWANTLTADLAAEITDSLSRSGRGPMLAPLKLTDGSVTAPSLTFNNETGTGLYRVGAGNPAMSVLGTKRQEWTTSGIVVNGTFGLTAGGFTTTLASGATSSYTLTTPTGLPASTLPLQMSAAGAMSTGQISGTQITDGSVADVDLASNAVTTAKILDANVTRAKLASVGQQVSSSSGAFTTTSSTLVDVTNLTVTITTTGRPVVIAAISDVSGGQSNFSVSRTSSTGSAYMHLRIYRDSTAISEQSLGIQAAALGVNYYYPPALFHLDAPTAGTYTYKVQVRCDAANLSANVSNVKLVAYEL